jgi:pimeloyl-ACP methyl ester carboxylesterase
MSPSGAGGPPSVTDTLTTSLGDAIAYDHHRPTAVADVPAVVFVAGAGPWRAIDPTTTRTAELLAARGVTAVVHDRVGRGASAASGPVSLEREVAALAALTDLVGPAVLVGHSSGCSIALYAAAHGLPVAGLALWEAPLAPPGSGGREWAEEIDRLLDAGDLDGALAAYMRDMPPEILEAVRATPAMVDQAGSLRPDAHSLAWAESAPHAELFGHLRVPVLAMVGEQTYDVMEPAARSVAAAVPGARWQRVPGAEHGWEPEAMAEVLHGFAGEAAAR